MEEVENILLYQLKTAGCDIDGLESIRDFTSEKLVKVCAQCLGLIFPTISFPERLPAEMSGRYKICNNMAAAMKKLGYSGEVGFNQFFYPNHSDVHKIIAFLIGQLPSKGSGEGGGENDIVGEGGATERRVMNALKEWGNRNIAWGALGAANRKDTGDFHAKQLSVPCITRKADSKTKDYYGSVLSYVTSQTEKECDVAASLIEANNITHVQAALKAERETKSLTSEASKDKRQALMGEVMTAVGASIARYQKKKAAGKAIAESYLEELQRAKRFDKGSLFTHQTDFGQDKMNTESMMSSELEEAAKRAHAEEALSAEELKRREAEAAEAKKAEERAAEAAQIKAEEDERAALSQKLEALGEEVVRLERDTEMKTASIRQFEVNLHTEQGKKDALEDEYKLKKRTFELLDDVEGNVKELQKIIAGTAQKLVDLGAEWEQHRIPLIAEFRNKKDALAQRKLDCKVKLEQVKFMKEEMLEIAAAVKEKDAYTQVLTSEYEKMPKGVSRGAYTRRIMEIVKNVKKQKAEIEKILTDTRAIQKEINNTSQTLQRTFTSADELLFRDARKHEYSKIAYKKFATLHETMQTLAKHVEETGHTRNAVRDLEAKIAKLSTANAALDTEQVKKDIENIKAENSALKAKIKSLRGQ